MGIFSRQAPQEETRADETTIDEPVLPATVAPPRPTGTGVTQATALSLSSVYRAVSIISTSVGQLSLDTWRGDTPVKAPAWVIRPDMKISRSLFLSETAVSLALSGNAFWRVIRDDAAAPINALQVLNPYDVTENTDGTYSYGTRAKPFQRWEIEHIKLLSVPGSKRGLGPIQACREDVKGALDVRDYAAEFFTSSGMANSILKTDQTLNNSQAESYLAKWLEKTYGPRVLGHGLDWKPMLLPPKDVQFLESRDFSTQEIARLFGIPGRLMGVDAGSSMDYQNTQDSDQQFYKFTLSAYTRVIEEAFSNLLPRTTTARFNLDAFIRANTKERYEAHKIAIEAGFLTVDEVRAIEGLAPLGTTND